MVVVTSSPPEVILQRLKKGNNRWKSGQSDINLQEESRKSTTYTEGQNPDTVIITCSDSRVIPEFIFDTSLSELFVIRLAGNVITPEVIASIEFAVSELNANFVLVLGHQNCGAVQSKLSLLQQKLKISDLDNKHMKALLEQIELDHESDSIDSINNHVKTNVKYQRNQILKKSILIREQTNDKKIKVMSGIYWIDTKQVEFIGE